ncbi:MAG: SRPBCC family protein [Actinomycetota bacterium]|nr:SRPBCC family protein [Actinomycetota bacterium]
MQVITVERVVPAPGAEVFQWLSEASNYTRSRFVLRERLVRPGRDAAYGLGAVRELTWVFGWFRERVTAYHPPREFEYQVERSFPPLRHQGGRLTFTEVPGGTRVHWTTTVELRLPMAAASATRLLGQPVIAYTFGQVIETAAAALGPAAERR